MSLQTFSLFVPACFAINMAFGPNNVLSLSNGARDGVRMSVLASFGRLVAFAIMIAIAGLGLGALLLASQTLFTADQVRRRGVSRVDRREADPLGAGARHLEQR